MRWSRQGFRLCREMLSQPGVDVIAICTGIPIIQRPADELGAVL